ncbi:MAG: hypothetical protein EZS28_004915 [Streblomastix strix]|uniref:Uncharacterized protein n=1 Tax=Streblomastix strix TaxID=222440 RepID=A0A5J4WXH6_9EUKA|nr:MAG: hypothetical protein EZS28_004915 [Streblomastix strix]
MSVSGATSEPIKGLIKSSIEIRQRHPDEDVSILIGVIYRFNLTNEIQFCGTEIRADLLSKMRDQYVSIVIDAGTFKERHQIQG